MACEGEIAKQENDFIKARALQEQALKLQEELTLENQQYELKIQIHLLLANTYRSLKEYSLAKGILEKVLAIYQQHEDSIDRSQLAEIYFNQAKVEQELSAYNEAKELLDKCLKLQLAYFGGMIYV